MSTAETNGPKLSRRLQHIAHLTVPGREMADVGTDHALLPCYLVHHRRVPGAIASDRERGPLAAAQANIERYHLGARVRLRHGDGLAPLAGAALGSLVLAGMGGHRIATIMERDAPPEAERLIIQANGGLFGLRHRVTACGWQLVDEWLFEDRGTPTSLMLWLRPGFTWAEGHNPPGPAEQMPPSDYCPKRDAPRVGPPSTWQEVDWLLGPQLRRRGGHYYRTWLSEAYKKLQSHWGQALAGQNNGRPGPDDALAPELRRRLELYGAELRALVAEDQSEAD